MKRRRGTAILLCMVIILSASFGSMAMGSMKNEYQRASPNDAERIEVVIEATMSNALLMAANISVGDDFEIDGTTLVKYKGNEKKVVIPDGIEVIGESAFTNSRIEEVVIPDSVKVLEKGAFEYTPELRKVEIGSGVTQIGDNAFHWNDKLETIEISNLNQNYYVENNALIEKDGQSLIQYCVGNKAKNYKIPNGVKFLDAYSFARSENLETVIIPDSVEGTSIRVFSDCINLKRVEVGSGLKSVYGCIFYNTPSLEEFIISPENPYFYTDDGIWLPRYSDWLWFYPAGKKSKSYRIPEGIRVAWFNGNSYLESIYISKDVEELGFDSAGNKMISLQSIEVSEDNETFSSENGVLYDKNRTVILQYPKGKKGTDFIVPETVTELVSGTIQPFPEESELKNIYFLGSCPRNIEREWADWIWAFSGDKVYNIYFYNDSSWEELQNAYEQKFGADQISLEINFFAFEKGKSFIVSDHGHNVWLGEHVKLKVVEPDLEHGIIKEKIPNFWRVESGNNVIDNDGMFTALVEETTKVVAGGNELPFNIEEEILVKKKRVQSIKILPLSMEIYDISIDWERQMSILEILPKDAYDKSVKWYSTNPDVVTIDEQGNIVVTSAGEAEVYCISQDGGNVESNRCKISVDSDELQKKPVKSVSIGPSSITLNVKGEKTLSVTITPTDAIDKAVTWHSTDTKIATVDGNGKVTAVAEGTAEIYCVSHDGNIESNRSRVEVVDSDSPDISKPEKKPVKIVTISPSSITLNVKGEKTLSATITPTDATDKAVTWYSTDTKIATVDGNGKVTAVAKGTAEIYCASRDGNIESNHSRVEVVDSDSPDISKPEKKPVKSVSISPSGVTLNAKEEKTLFTTITPADATDKTVTWHSTDTKIATVDGSGKVTAVAKGTVEIYCVAQDGKIESNHCKVTVVSASNSGNGGGSGSGGGGSNSGGSLGSSGGNSGSGGGSPSSGGSSGSNGGSPSSGGSSGSSGGSPSSGGSSGSSSGSSGSGGGSSSGGISRQESSSLPSYVIQGTWNQNEDGSWSFTDLAGNKCINKWEAVANSYADTTKGQQGFDWFRFDESGKMITGWYYDLSEGFWYYLNPISDNTLGRMITGWYMIDGYYYYFNTKSDGHRGRMYVSETTPDGYQVDENGRWIK